MCQSQTISSYRILNLVVLTLTLTSHMQQAVSPYAPTVIKELLNEVIATGHGPQVRHNIARHFFSSAPHHLTKATVLPERGDSQLDDARQRVMPDEHSDDSQVSEATTTVAAAGCAEQVTDQTQQGDILMNCILYVCQVARWSCG